MLVSKTLDYTEERIWHILLLQPDTLFTGKGVNFCLECKRNLLFSFFRTSTTVDLHEIDENSKPFSDKNLSVKPVVVYPVKNSKRNYQAFSSSGSESESSSSESENRLGKNPIAVEKEAQKYRQKVVNMMFTNTNQGQKPPGHTIEAECSPRPDNTVHPLSEEAKSTSKILTNNQKDYLMKALPKAKQDTSAITYICQGTSVPPKFNKAAAIALGIKPGPVYGQLQKGIEVTLEDGRVVTRDMVCDPEVPGHVFVVVDCPNASYIDGLINSKEFDTYLDPKGKSKINVMIHNLGNSVIHDTRYKEWLSKFDATTDVSNNYHVYKKVIYNLFQSKHIFGSTDICAQTVQFTSHAIGQVKLNKLNESIFPIPFYSNIPEIKLSDGKHFFFKKNMGSVY